MIVVVAPYSPITLSDVPSLGGARKIEAVISILARLDSNLVLINSAHNSLLRSGPTNRKLMVGEIEVTEHLPTTLRSRKLGKLLNLLQVTSLVRAITRLGKPRLIWLYNGYAFESLFAIAIRRQVNCPIILEFEDWHFARRRGLNPKPYLDYLAWRKVMPKVNYVFAVNAELARRVSSFGVPVYLFPGIVPVSLAKVSMRRRPFSGDTSTTTVGYFGELSTEKGIDVMLKLAEQLPANVRLLISGAGPLESALTDTSQRLPQVLSFQGQVSASRLYELIGQCDVILNLHKPISKMHNGVFPFKVIEAVASGRLLISTALPDLGLEDVLASVKFCHLELGELVNELSNAREHYKENEGLICAVASAVCRRFSEDAVLAKIQEFLSMAQSAPVN